MTMDAYPEDWTTYSIGQIGDPLMCKRILKEQTEESGDVPFYKIGTFGRKADAYISRGLYEDFKSKHSYPKKGDILISAAGTIGRLVVFDGEDAYFQDSNIVWLGNDETIVLNLYLYWAFQNMKWQSEDGGIVSRLYNNNFKAMQLVVPPLPEQRRIAAALGDMDKLIDNLSKRIEKKKAIKQGAMQELLTGKKRLPGFEGEWEMVRIGNIGDFYGGLSGKTAADFGHGEAQYITFMNVLTNIVINRHQVGKVCVYPGEHQNAVKKGDLFFNVSSETPEEVAMCAALLEDMPNTYLNSFCCGFRLFDDSNDPLFISYYVNSHEGRKMTKFLAQGLTRHNLSKDAFRKMEMNWPKKSEQRAIAKVLGDMDAEIAKLEAKREKLTGIKKGMMSDLLTGKVRLKGGTE